MKGRFLAKENNNSSITESYRKIAVNIEIANIDRDIQTIMITSSMPGEGKTTTICNIASVMTDFKKNILLLDLDLRKPSVHKFFNILNGNGITDLLLNKDDYKNYIYSLYPGLDVITAGKIPSNPAEVINSKALKNLLNNLKSHYDYILIDTPPILLVSDSITIANLSDASILVVASGQTEKEMSKKSIESLRQINANIVGIVLNKVTLTNHNKYYYGYS